MPPTTPPVADLDPARAVTSCPPLPRLPSRGRLVTGQPEPALFAWVMDSNEGADEPVPFWPAEVHL